MKMILPRTKWILSLTPLLTVASLIFCYSVLARTPSTDSRRTDEAASGPSSEQVIDVASDRDNDENLENPAVRQEYLNRLLGSFPIGLSPADYAKALAAARALPPPPSPLLSDGQFVPVKTEEPDMLTAVWAYPAIHPISTPPPVTGVVSMFHAIAAHPSDSSTVYGGSYGGLAKSTNGGTNWQYLSDTWTSQEVSSIAIDPTQPNYVYVGTGRDYAPSGVGLYRSFNGGTNWGILGATEFQGTVMNRVAIDPRGSGSKSATTVWVANSRNASAGLWRSTSSGSTWTRMRQGPNPSNGNGIYDIAIDSATNPSTLYIVQDDGVFMSIDGGTSWGSAIYGTPGTLRVVNSVPYLIAFTGNPPANRLYKRVSGTWTEIPTLCDANAFWCVQGQPIGAGPPLIPPVFAVDPNNSSVILYGREILFRTADANAANPTWTHLGFGNMHADQRALTFSPVLSGLVYSGNDGGIWKSLSSGASDTWANLNQYLPGMLPYSIGISRDDTMMSGTQDNGAIFSNQGGQWDMLWTGDSGHALVNPNPSSGNTVYFTIGWNAASYWIRIDNPRMGPPGEVWCTPGRPGCIRPLELDAEINGSLCSYVPAFNLNPSIPQNLVAACQTVAQSTDRGDTWRALGAPIGGGTQATAVSIVSEAPSSSSVIYAAVSRVSPLPTPTDRVFVTANAPSPTPGWTDITGTPGSGGLPLGTKIGALIVHPTNAQIVYVAGNTGVYKSTNMGPWTSLNAPAGMVYTGLAIDPVNTDHLFAATRLAGVFRTTTNETTWAPVTGMPVGMFVSALSFNGTSRQLAASTYGRGVYILDLDDVPPTVVITTPTNGATVGQTVTIAATATDNHRVVGVQFKLDGANLQTEDTSYPYSIQWNTLSTPTGLHTLTAVARDPTGNTTTSLSVTVNVIRDW